MHSTHICSRSGAARLLLPRDVRRIVQQTSSLFAVSRRRPPPLLLSLFGRGR
jgi:hypothetical protein